MSSTLVLSLRWTARILGFLVLAMVLFIAFGEGYPNPLTLRPTEQLLSLLMLVMLLGIPIAWKWEAFGGSLLLAGYTCFSIVEHRTFALFSFFSIFLLLGLLNLIIGIITERAIPKITRA